MEKTPGDVLVFTVGEIEQVASIEPGKITFNLASSKATQNCRDFARGYSFAKGWVARVIPQPIESFDSWFSTHRLSEAELI